MTSGTGLLALMPKCRCRTEAIDYWFGAGQIFLGHSGFPLFTQQPCNGRGVVYLSQPPTFGHAWCIPFLPHKILYAEVASIRSPGNGLKKKVDVGTSPVLE